MTTAEARISRDTAVWQRILTRNHALPAVVAAAGALIQFFYIRRGGFFLDDIQDLGQAKAGLSMHLLTSPIAGIHFQPAGRFMEWLVAVPFHTSYQAAETLLAVFTAVATYLLIRLLDTLFGARSLHLVLGFLFATSWLVLSTNQWFAGANTVPSAAFAIGAALGFCLWLKGRGLLFYVAALVSAVIALLFWEQAVAIPGWLLLLWLCFARDSPRSVRQVLLALAPFVAISLAYVAYVSAQPWHTALVVPPSSQWGDWLWMPVFHGLVPTLMGSATATTARSASVIGASIGIAALAAWLMARRQFRWSAIPFFVGGAVLVIAPVAAGRTADGPVITSVITRYLVFLLFITVVSLAGAVRPAPMRRPSIRARVIWIGGIVAIGALYLIHLNHTFGVNWYNENSGRAAAAYTKRVGTGLAALRPSQRDSVVDSILPYPVWYMTNNGLNELSSLLPFWSSSVRTLGEGAQLTSLDPAGTLRWATFHAGGKGPKVVRVVVSAAAPVTMVVRISATAATEPQTPWKITVGPGVHSFTLPAWSLWVRSVAIQGARRVRVQVGTLSLGRSVSQPA